MTSPVAGSIEVGASPPAPPSPPPPPSPEPPFPPSPAPGAFGSSVVGSPVPVASPHGPSPSLSHAAGCGAIWARTLLLRFLPSNVGLLHDFTSRLFRSTSGSAVCSLASCWKPACTRLSGSGEQPYGPAFV